MAYADKEKENAQRRNRYHSDTIYKSSKLARSRADYARRAGITVEELDARIAERKAAKEAREKCPKVKKIKPRASPGIRSATMPASPPKVVFREKKPGLMTLRSLGKWRF